MFNKKRKMDERELLELYKVEHICFWIMYAVMFAGIVVESFIMNVDFAQMAVEWIAFMIGSVGIVVGCVKKGQWGCSFEPSIPKYILFSIAGGLIVAVTMCIGKYVQYEQVRENIPALLGIGICGFLPTSILIFLAFLATGAAIEKKRKKLEEEFEDDDSIEK